MIKHHTIFEIPIGFDQLPECTTNVTAPVDGENIELLTPYYADRPKVPINVSSDGDNTIWVFRNDIKPIFPVYYQPSESGVGGQVKHSILRQPIQLLRVSRGTNANHVIASGEDLSVLHAEGISFFIGAIVLSALKNYGIALQK